MDPHRTPEFVTRMSTIDNELPWYDCANIGTNGSDLEMLGQMNYHLGGYLKQKQNINMKAWCYCTSEPSETPLEALNGTWQVYLAILYSVTAFTSFLLNAITVIVLARCRRSELRKYLINLSVSDLLMSLFSIPFTYTEYMLGRWIFPSILCPLVRLVVTLSVFVSAATMVVIGINRHLAIMYPFRRGGAASSSCGQWTRRKNHVIYAIWLLGFGISLPESLMFSTEPFCHQRQLYHDCHQGWPDFISNSYTVFIFLVTFAIPLSMLIFLYTRMGLKLWYRQMPGNVDVNRDLTMQTKRVKVIKMLFVVVTLFAISWLPLQTFMLINFLNPDVRMNFQYQSLQYNIFVYAYFGSHWLSMAHSCFNPVIYCFMNDKFRGDLQALLCPSRAPSACGPSLGSSGTIRGPTCRLTSTKQLNSNNINDFVRTGSRAPSSSDGAQGPQKEPIASGDGGKQEACQESGQQVNLATTTTMGSIVSPSTKQPPSKRRSSLRVLWLASRGAQAREAPGERQQTIVSLARACRDSQNPQIEINLAELEEEEEEEEVVVVAED